MRFLAHACLALTALLPIACSAAETASYTEGKQYNKVREASRPADPKRIVVEEFFWYGCGHCFAFEGPIEKWAAQKAADVDFVRVPNSLGRPVGMIHTRAFYTAESLNILDKVHRPLFEAIHNQHRNLDTQESLQAFFAEKTGVLPDIFNNTFGGFAVDSRARSAEARAKQYAVASTPSIVVDGRYVINATSAGSFTEMLKVTDFLVNKVRSERKKK